MGKMMLPMQQSTDVHGGFQILSFENSLLFLPLMKKYVFNSSVYETLATTYENCLYYSMLFLSSQGGAHGYTSHTLI